MHTKVPCIDLDQNEKWNLKGMLEGLKEKMESWTGTIDQEDMKEGWKGGFEGKE